MESETWQSPMIFLALVLIIVWTIHKWNTRVRYITVYQEVENPAASPQVKTTPEKHTRKTPIKTSENNVRRRLFTPLDKRDNSSKPDNSSRAIKIDDFSYKKKRDSPYGQADDLIFNPKPIIEEPQIPLSKEKSYTEPPVKPQPMETEAPRPQEVYPQQHIPVQQIRRPIDPIAQEKEDESKRVALFNAILKGINLVRKRKQLEALASKKSSKGVITIIKKVQEATNKHNTVCLVCFNTCHLECNLKVIKEKGSSKFKECQAFDKQDNCLVCKHHFSSHAHQSCIWKEIQEKFDVGEVEYERRQTMKQIDANALFILDVIYSITEENVETCLRIIKEQKYYYRNDQEMQGYLDDVGLQLQTAKSRGQRSF